MDNDDEQLTTARRPSTTLDRPTRIPFGPRIRTKTKHSLDTADTPASPLSSALESRPGSPSILAPFPLTTYAHAAIQAPSTSSTPSTPAPPQRSAPTTFVPPPTLTSPPNISFDSLPIPWKGLPLDAAQWTFSSPELQDIVSKAIRLSARESFIRLLSLQALEVDIPEESERLATERATAHAKWRFEVGRRTMLMQALNSTVAASANPLGFADHEGDANLITSFIAQLASSIASCDALLGSILQSSDQQSQVTLVQQQHWSSALAVALRKLNKAYERQGQELKRAKERVLTLEDELEEAWREAEKMAIEFDELEHDVAESDEEAYEGSEAQPAEDTLAHELETGTLGLLKPMHDIDETGTVGDMTINTDIAVVVGVTATAVASKATLFNSPGTPKFFDKSDTKSIRSVKSTRSRRSIRDGPSHTSRVSAARTRSRAASNASLRLPKSLRSPSSTQTSPIDAPPMPAVFPPPNAHGQSFLDMESVTQERALKDIPPLHDLPPEASLTLPTPPHSAGLQPTRVPSIWLETDGGKSSWLNGLDRAHSLQVFSSLAGRAPYRRRRSKLIMSLKASDRGSDSATPSPIEGSGTNTPGEWWSGGTGSGTNGAGSSGVEGSPLSTASPVSLPTHALSHFHTRGPSGSSDSHGNSDSKAGRKGKTIRPGSAGARLTTTPAKEPERNGDTRTATMQVATLRRSIVSRASSVILRRLSAATMGSVRTMGEKRVSPSRSREGLRIGETLVEGMGKLGEGGEGEGQEGEVMVIGSPHAESSEGP